MAKQIPAAVRHELKATMLKGGMDQPQLAEIVQHFVDLLGGPRALAQTLLLEYRRVDCTPATRARIIDMMLGAMTTTQKQFEGVDSVGLLTDEDLAKALDARLRAMEMKATEEHGQKEAAAPRTAEPRGSPPPEESSDGAGI